MVQAIQVQNKSGVRVTDGVVIIEELTEDDAEVVSLVAESADPEGAVRACLQIGARATVAAGASLDTLVVERAFEQLVDGFGTTVSDAVNRVVSSTEGLVDEEDGPVPALLRQVRSELTGQLEALFDADSKSSAIGRMEKVFSEAAMAHAKSMKAALDPADAKSPLGEWKAEVLRTLREQVGLVLSQVTEMAAAQAARDAHVKTFSLTTMKGQGFEEELHAALGELAVRHGDLAEHVGAQGGSAGTKRGDEVVHLSEADTGGRHAAIVFEAKHRKLGMRQTMEELDAALTNREASVAIAVFADPTQAPAAVPFTYFANKAIVVLDATLDTRALELAYMWARIEARKTLGKAATSIDIARAEVAMGDVHRALTRASTVRRCHTSAKKAIDQASGEVDALVDDVDTALAQLRLELGT